MSQFDSDAETILAALRDHGVDDGIVLRLLRGDGYESYDVALPSGRRFVF